MALTLADLDTLDEAIATGALKVRYADGREVTYRNMDDMMRARQFVADRVAPAADAGYARTTYVEHGRD